MKGCREIIAVALLTACTTAPTDRLDLPKEGWPIACKVEITRLKGELEQRRIELHQLHMQHDLLQWQGRNSTPPF